MRRAVFRPPAKVCGDCGNSDDGVDEIEGKIRLAVTLPCASPRCHPANSRVEAVEGGHELFYQRMEVQDGGEHRRWTWVRLFQRYSTEPKQ